MPKVKCPNCGAHVQPRPRDNSRQRYYRCLFCDPEVEFTPPPPRETPPPPRETPPPQPDAK